MTIEVLVCRADESQETETREVPDNYFDVPTESTKRQNCNQRIRVALTQGSNTSLSQPI